MKATRHTFKYWQWRVIICSMISYAMFYFVRKNFSFAMPLLKEEFGITNASFGIILSIAGIIYGVSKFLNGILSDRTNPRWHLVIGLSVCVAVNFLFGFSDKLSTLITGYPLGLFADKFGWHPIFLLMAGFAVVGCIIVATLWNLKGDGYIHDEVLEQES